MTPDRLDRLHAGWRIFEYDGFEKPVPPEQQAIPDAILPALGTTVRTPIDHQVCVELGHSDPQSYTDYKAGRVVVALAFVRPGERRQPVFRQGSGSRRNVARVSGQERATAE